jgi:hypothetical protein
MTAIGKPIKRRAMSGRKKTLIAFFVTLPIVLGIAVVAALSIRPTGESTEAETQDTSCEMVAADVRMFAEDKKAGVSLEAELHRYGNSDLRRTLISATYRLADKYGTQATPAMMQETLYEECRDRQQH